MSGVESSGDGVRVRGRGAIFGVHVCKLCLNELVVCNRRGKLEAIVSVGED